MNLTEAITVVERKYSDEKQADEQKIKTCKSNLESFKQELTTSKKLLEYSNLQINCLTALMKDLVLEA